MLVALDRNRVTMTEVSEDSLFEMATSIVAHTFPLADGIVRTSDSEVEALVKWTGNHSRRIVRGDKAIRISEFREQLESMGCIFGPKSKNYVKIENQLADGPRVTAKMGYPNDHFEVGVPDIKRIRRQLALGVSEGIDSAAFYSLETAVNGFVNEYRQVLQRLADA